MPQFAHAHLGGRHLKSARALGAVIALWAGAAHAQVLTGSAALGDWTTDKPGVTRKISVKDLPAVEPNQTVKVFPNVVDLPANAPLQVPPGFTVTPYGAVMEGPRALTVAPNGDVFVSETLSGRIRVLRPAANGAAPASVEIFAEGLDAPFGVAFYPAVDPKWVYVAENNAIRRFAYQAGAMKAAGAPQVVVAQLSATTGGHTTRDLDFSADGKRMLVSIGSQTNFARLRPQTPEQIAAFEREHGLGAAWDGETGRAVVLSFDPEGKDRKPYANGVRNCVSLKRKLGTDDFYCTVNERDWLGNNLVPDYFSRIKEGGFYGWPWYYLGDNVDTRVPFPRPDLVGKMTLPDVLIQSHSAPIEAAFYPTTVSGPGAFPAEYRGDAFVTLHGSQNRTTRTGNKVVRILMKDGVPTGEYQDFVTGLVVAHDKVLGRPSGIAVLNDGSLLFTDDIGGRLWRVAYTGP